MGVLEPVAEEICEGVPATPPGLRDLGSEDDLYAPEDITYRNEYFQDFLPVLPAKGDFRNIMEIGSLGQWGLQKKKPCSGCVDDMKKDLRKLADIVEEFKKERDTVRVENESLKKEVEELKKLLKQKDDLEKGEVKVTVSNSEDESVDVFVKKKNFLNEKPANYNRYGIQSFSISLPKENIRSAENYIQPEVRPRKTVAELRREFFAKEFKTAQETFTSAATLEITPEVKKETIKSKLAFRIKPKKKITELISKLTSKMSTPKPIPEPEPITMFQRFEKTRVQWQSVQGSGLA